MSCISHAFNANQILVSILAFLLTKRFDNAGHSSPVRQTKLTIVDSDASRPGSVTVCIS